MFEKLEEEIEEKADEYALEESTACNYGEATNHVYQGYFYGYKEGARFGLNKAMELVTELTNGFDADETIEKAKHFLSKINEFLIKD